MSHRNAHAPPGSVNLKDIFTSVANSTNGGEPVLISPGGSIDIKGTYGLGEISTDKIR